MPADPCLCVCLVLAWRRGAAVAVVVMVALVGDGGVASCMTLQTIGLLAGPLVPPFS